LHNTLVISSLSVQPIWLPVSDVDPILGEVDPTTGGVQVSFTNGGDPETWGAGIWEPDPLVVSNSLGTTTYYLVRVTVGSALIIPKGFWQLWIKINLNSLDTIIPSSMLYVF
jgi:hypothetical protein